MKNFNYKDPSTVTLEIEISDLNGNLIRDDVALAGKKVLVSILKKRGLLPEKGDNIDLRADCNKEINFTVIDLFWTFCKEGTSVYVSMMRHDY